MSESSLRRPPAARHPLLDASRRDDAGTRDPADLADRAADQLEDRVIALEQIIAARWPRSMFARRRLARELRASVAGYGGDWIGRGFAERRVQFTGETLVRDSLKRRNASAS